jgi:cyclic pyranopterin phosphate synthase
VNLPILAQIAPLPSGFENGPRSISSVRVLRISLTDRCNYRCAYCMPEDGVPWLAKQDLLTADEILEIAQAAMEVHGITRFKLTGGEPTLRADLIPIIRQLRQSGADDISITTNGQLLEHLVAPLRKAGLDRITVSIDSLHPEKFRRITRSGDLCAVMAGLDRAESEGFSSLKINCVTMRGINDDELADFARLTLTRRLTVRFIEYMPLGDAALMYAGPAAGCEAQERGVDALVPESVAREAIERKLGPLIPVDRQTESGVGPATVWHLALGHPRGRIGFISAMSTPFCATCNRLRLTPDGLLRSCLFDGGEVDLKPILRDGKPDHSRALADAMEECIRLKPELHSHHGNKQMSRIGG